MSENTLKLREQYAGKKTTGWKVDQETEAVIVYAVEAIYINRAHLEQYGLLGGSLELGEDYKVCAVRELLQESDLLAREEDMELKDVYVGQKHVTRYPSEDIVFHTVAVYSIEYSNCYTIDSKVNKEETKAASWLSISNLKRMLMED